MTTKLYGIKSCDTVRKARKWLDTAGVHYDYVDLREDPVSQQTLRSWLKVVGNEDLVNRRSTTWKGLSDAERDLASGAQAAALLAMHPTLIKRPLLEHDGKTLVGFDDARYQTEFNVS